MDENRITERKENIRQSETFHNDDGVRQNVELN